MSRKVSTKLDSTLYGISYEYKLSYFFFFIYVKLNSSKSNMMKDWKNPTQNGY